VGPTTNPPPWQFPTAVASYFVLSACLTCLEVACSPTLVRSGTNKFRTLGLAWQYSQHQLLRLADASHVNSELTSCWLCAVDCCVVASASRACEQSCEETNFLVQVQRLHHEISSIFLPLSVKNKSLLELESGVSPRQKTGSISPLSPLSTHSSSQCHGRCRRATHSPLACHTKLHPNHGKEANQSTVEPQELPKRAPQANKGFHWSSDRLRANCKTARLTGSRKANHNTTLIGTVLSIVTCAAHDSSQRI
jgi:hypothetical protein